MPAASVDNRFNQLGLWTAQQLRLAQVDLRPLGGDAGFRRYFRFSSPSRFLAVDAPPSTEDTPQFVRVANLLSSHQIRTPRILAVDESQGVLLIEDLGDALMYQLINSENSDHLYSQASDLIVRMQQIQEKPDWLPVYDQDFLWREMNLFTEWFVGKLLRYSVNGAENKLIDNAFQKLLASAAEQPQGFVHRDFHSRNLLICENSLATIDFQGALWGPMTYDLVSLLRDCYLRWPQEKVRHWALEFYQKQQALSTIQFSSEAFLKWFDWMGLQRHIKVLGIFARLHLRDNKHHYLNDLPLVIRYTLEVSSSYAELKAFNQWFSKKLLPLAEQQSWYRDYRSAGDRP